jgi:rRNA biogenesis protein RRP5
MECMGQVVRGTVKSVQSFGVFVRLRNSDLSGLCHISEVSEEFVKDLAKQYAVGDAVKAKVLRKDDAKKTISLGMKDAYFEGADDALDDDEDDEEEEEEEGSGAAARVPREDEEEDEDGDGDTEEEDEEEEEEEEGEGEDTEDEEEESEDEEVCVCVCVCVRARARVCARE